MSGRGDGPFVPVPEHARTFAARRRVRLADRDARGRLRLDAVARYLQDAAIDDVQETGWGVPEHLWFIRSIRVDVLAPPLEDTAVELVTWCSGLATLAAGRRWSVTGDRGGRIEVESVWIHLGPDALPARIGDFGLYGEAAAGKPVTTRLQLAAPSADSDRRPWPLRAADVDTHGHVNNAVHWEAVEELLLEGGPDPRRPLRARLDYREPLDLGDELDLLLGREEGRLTVAFTTPRGTRAVAAVEPLG